uniref:DUF8040 domain-containing protein n=1 Tax=Cucumis melo TaxID=3656 RepID=A0A9I9E9G1_CUCME
MGEHELAYIVNVFIASQRQLLLTLELLKNDTKRITHIPYEIRHRIRQLAYFRMIHGSDLVCRQSTRMDQRCFAILCHLLRTIAELTSTEVVDVEEMVAMYLHILAHDVKNRVIQREFMRSGEIISRHFNMVLLAVIRLHGELLKKPQPVPNDCTDQRWRGRPRGVPRGVGQCWWVEVRQRDLSPRSHPAAKGLLNKLFVHYDELSYVFGKDRSTGGRVESFADIGSNDPAGYDAFAADAAPDTDFPSMYSQGLNMSPDDLMGTRIARVSERRNVSSRSKRKRPGHAIDSGNIVRTAIEYENEQLNHIAEWPVLQRQDASQTRQEIIRQLEAIPELTLMDRCRLMCILMRNVDDMKAFLEVPDNIKYPYCSIILQENR